MAKGPSTTTLFMGFTLCFRHTVIGLPAVSRSLTIGVAAEQVYAVYVDLSSWTAWNPHLLQVVPLFEGPLALGSRARVRPRRGPSAAWRVTNLQPGRSFTWETRIFAGLRLRFDHIAEPDPSGQGTRATLRLSASGPLGPLGLLAGLFYARNMERALIELRSLLVGRTS